MHYVYENGRRYHAYREGKYLMPNDEKEQDRLDLLHHIFKLLLKGDLFITPLPSDPQRVLDFGTGTGIWALDFADQYPSAEVIGTDLSPIQPAWVAPNCRFVVDDVESPWAWGPDMAFDFIHGRGMVGCISDWSKLFKEVYRNLKPGGYLEMQEYETWIRSDDDPDYKNAPNISTWQTKVDEASMKFGKRLRIAGQVKQMMIDAGFEDVTEKILRVSSLAYLSRLPRSTSIETVCSCKHLLMICTMQLPIGPWPKDPKQKEIGSFQLLQSLDGVESFTLAIFTRVLGWSAEETEVLMAGVRSEFKDRKNHLYSLIHFVSGRKPEDK